MKGLDFSMEKTVEKKHRRQSIPVQLKGFLRMKQNPPYRNQKTGVKVVTCKRDREKKDHL
jgi:hypothetical protein